MIKRQAISHIKWLHGLFLCFIQKMVIKIHLPLNQAIQAGINTEKNSLHHPLTGNMKNKDLRLLITFYTIRCNAIASIYVSVLLVLLIDGTLWNPTFQCMTLFRVTIIHLRESPNFKTISLKHNCVILCNIVQEQISKTWFISETQG